MIMKLISLNTWGGTLNQELLKFIEEHTDIDFLLFQEVRHHATKEKLWNGRENLELFEDIRKRLPHHTGYFAPTEDDDYGLAGFINTSYLLRGHGDIFVYRNRGDISNGNDTLMPRNLQYFDINAIKPFTLLNVHGLWSKEGKKDSLERIHQSEKIIKYTKTIEHDYVLVGDFNLLPDTESMKLLENNRMRNLIKEYNITSTRTSYYTKSNDTFADYVLVTSGIKVIDFQALADEVSDHRAMYLEFELI